MPETPAAKALAANLRDELGITGPRTKLRFGAWNLFATSVEDWPDKVQTALYGIDYARRTGRLPGATNVRLRHLSDWQMCNLIADVATSCQVIGEVPAYLNRHYSTRADSETPPI